MTLLAKSSHHATQRGVCVGEEKKKYFRGMNSYQIYLALNVIFYSSKGIFQIEQKMHANIGYIDNKNKTAKGS